MVLRATSEVETLRENPYDFLLTPTNQRLPIGYQPWEAGAAWRRAAARGRADSRRPGPRAGRANARGVRAAKWCRSWRGSPKRSANRFKVIHREQGGPWPPATTIEQRQGACRDLAVLWIDICRSVGLAARFVSGYQEGDADQDKRYLHAWAEVYLPGAGWRGFDPTHGLAVADRHVAVAAAADPQHAAPVTATYRGNNVEAELYADVIDRDRRRPSRSPPANLAFLQAAYLFPRSAWEHNASPLLRRLIPPYCRTR